MGGMEKWFAAVGFGLLSAGGAQAERLHLTCAFVSSTMHDPGLFKRPVQLDIDLETKSVRLNDGRPGIGVQVRMSRTSVEFRHNGTFYNHYYALHRPSGQLRMKAMLIRFVYRCRKAATG